MTNLKDVAYRSGCDVATVSRVLQGSGTDVPAPERERILQAAAELGYWPEFIAKELAADCQAAIAIIGNEDTSLDPLLLKGIRDGCREIGADLLQVVVSGSHPSAAGASLVLNGRADGVIIADPDPSSQVLAELKRRAIPAISLSRMGDNLVSSVVVDEPAAFAAQARYLLELGHSSIAYASQEPESSCMSLRRQAFSAVMHQHGLVLPPSRCFAAPDPAWGGEDLARSILALKPRATAVACTSADLAARLIHELQKLGASVPKDISVIGYGDSERAEWVSPGATTVRMPVTEQGRRAVKRLYLQICQEGQPVLGEVLSNPVTIMERGSCARPCRS